MSDLTDERLAEIENEVNHYDPWEPREERLEREAGHVPALISALRSRGVEIAALRERVSNAHVLIGDYVTRVVDFRARAEAAEARLAEAVAVLREIDHERQHVGHATEDTKAWNAALDAIAPVLKAYDDAIKKEPAP